MNLRAAALLSAFGLFLLSRPAWAWFAEGHQFVAIIAAEDLTPTTRSARGANSGRSYRCGFGRKGDVVLILQHTEFRQTKTIQLKLDELLRAMEQARTDLVHLEAKPDENIESLDQEFEQLQEHAAKNSREDNS